jgi:hypothetical protein
MLPSDTPNINTPLVRDTSNLVNNGEQINLAPSAPILETEPNKPQKSILFRILIGLIIFLLVSTLAWLFITRLMKQSPTEESTSISTTTPTSSVAADNSTADANTCNIFWVDPVLPELGNVEPLFMRESSAVSGTGYEGIIRRTVSDDGYINVDVVTNQLPAEHAPYYFFALAVDMNGNVCYQANLGPLELIEEAGVWSAGGFSLPISNVNDAQVFAITQDNFGAQETDQIHNLDDSSIILLGTYMTNQNL